MYQCNTQVSCCRCLQVDALVRRGRVRVDGAVVKSPKMKLPVDCVIEVRYMCKLRGDNVFAVRQVGGVCCVSGLIS